MNPKAVVTLALVKDSVPPNVIVPVDVIVPPVNVKPLTVPAVATDVTPELVTYLPSKSTVRELRPLRAAVRTPVPVFQDKLLT